eukprot:1190918-Pyramimonas_sp.AAC.1
MRSSQTILEVSAASGAKPNNVMASVYPGAAMLEDAVVPRVYGAKKLKEMVPESSVRRGGLTEMRVDDGDDDDDAGAAGSAPAAGSGEGGGRRGAGEAEATAQAGLTAPPLAS